MLRRSLLAVDERMEGLGSQLFTPPQHSRDLSAYDTLVFQVVVASAGGTNPKLSVQVEHSLDGRLWMPVGPSPEIGSLPLNLGQPTSGVGHAGSTPRLRYTRLRLDLDDSSPAVPTFARVRLRIAARDVGKRAWCPCQVHAPSDGTHHRTPPDFLATEPFELDAPEPVELDFPDDRRLDEDDDRSDEGLGRGEAPVLESQQPGAAEFDAQERTGATGEAVSARQEASPEQSPSEEGVVDESAPRVRKHEILDEHDESADERAEAAAAGGAGVEG